MKLLQSSGDLAPDKLFEDLQSDITGFLLNQKQKNLQNIVQKGKKRILISVSSNVILP